MDASCARVSSDETYIGRWGNERFEKYYGKYGIDSIWAGSKAQASSLRLVSSALCTSRKIPSDLLVMTVS
jgi:hypothetical protein